ncbi:MAG: cupin domain-containing protein [Burkholderiales bacterium]|nr:cupin domain-containing protein [Burkholderiales bacterium]
MSAYARGVAMDQAAQEMSFESPRGEVRVVRAGGGRSYWQPKPANGYAEVILASSELASVHRFSLGRQLLPPGGRVRLHAHDRAEEVFHVLQGTGVAEIDGEAHRLEPGTTLYFGHNRQHTIINDGSEDLAWLWLFLPGRLEDFFAAIGRERRAGEPAPAPFERPADVREIEKRTVFA